MAKFNVEQLERRDNPSTVLYDPDANTIFYNAAAGEVNIVAVGDPPAPSSSRRRGWEWSLP